MIFLSFFKHKLQIISTQYFRCNQFSLVTVWLSPSTDIKSLFPCTFAPHIPTNYPWTAMADTGGTYGKLAGWVEQGLSPSTMTLAENATPLACQKTDPLVLGVPLFAFCENPFPYPYPTKYLFCHWLRSSGEDKAPREREAWDDYVGF